MVKTFVLSSLSGVAYLALMGGLLFGCAGRWDLPMFWAYLGVWLAALVAGQLLADPTLFKERLRPGPGGRDYLKNLRRVLANRLANLAKWQTALTTDNTNCTDNKPPRPLPGKISLPTS